jgi:hypothetical protein
LFSFAYCTRPCPICLRFDRLDTEAAVERARLSVGSKTDINTAMIPITTKSSTSVKPFFPEYDTINPFRSDNFDPARSS